MAGHDVSVNAETAHRATCNCGWRGPVRSRRFDAFRDLAYHVARAEGWIEALPELEAGTAGGTALAIWGSPARSGDTVTLRD